MATEKKFVVRISEEANTMARELAARDEKEFGVVASELIVTGYNRRAAANAYAHRQVKAKTAKKSAKKKVA